MPIKAYKKCNFIYENKIILQSYSNKKNLIVAIWSDNHSYYKKLKLTTKKFLTFFQYNNKNI